MLNRLLLLVPVAAWTWVAWSAEPARKPPVPQFQTSDRCVACHNGLATSSGEDISIGFAWRPTMMANAARDPYWQAGVRRETIDHPESRAAIEDECSICHMPMAQFESKQSGHEGEVFAHLGFNPDAARRPAGGGRRLLLAVPPDRKGKAGDARELRGRIRNRSGDSPRRAA